MDIVVSGTRGRRTCISVHRQTAPFSGIFRPAEYYQGADEYIAQSVHTADLNGDGFPDIAVADEGISVFFQSPGAPGRFGPVTRVFEDD